MCGIYYCITCMCKSHLHLVSFLFVPALCYTLRMFPLLVSSLFVLSDVIVEDIVDSCTCTCTYIQKGNDVLLFVLWYV